MPNLKVYGAALAVALVLVVAVALFAPGEVGSPLLSDKQVAFDGSRAVASLRFITAQFPNRTAGSVADQQCADWVAQQLGLAGLETRDDRFTAVIDGREVALRNVWAVSRGSGAEAVLVLANRDVPPGAAQGANNNASGLAALLELGRSLNLGPHGLNLIFLATSGDARGALGARRFLETYDGVAGTVRVVVAVRDLATRGADGLAVDGWSTAPRVAPPWLWLLTAPAAHVYARHESALPGLFTQVLRLAAPVSAGGQGPFVADGLPAMTISAAGETLSPADDVRGNVSGEELSAFGAAVEALLLSLDSGPLPVSGSGGAIFPTRESTLPQWALQLLLAAGFLPLLTVTVDLFAQCRRGRLRLRGAVLIVLLRALPWLAALVALYLAGLLGFLPRSSAIVLSPWSPAAADPTYAVAGVLVLILLLVSLGTWPLARRVPADRRTLVFVAHASLLLIALLTWFVNPYALLLLLPAALLWPLARPGAWPRSVLPVALGLSMLAVVLVAYAFLLDVGWTVWWYVLLLIETAVVPVALALLGAFLFAAAGMLMRSLRAARPAVPAAGAPALPAGPGAARR